MSILVAHCSADRRLCTV